MSCSVAPYGKDMLDCSVAKQAQVALSLIEAEFQLGCESSCHFATNVSDPGTGWHEGEVTHRLGEDQTLVGQRAAGTRNLTRTKSSS